MASFTSARDFQLWDYSVSHAQLLVRSASDERDSTSRNVDVVFSGVFYLDTVDLFHGVQIEAASNVEVAEMERRCGVTEDEGHRYFVVRSGNRHNIFGAAFYRVTENSLHPGKTSLDFPRHA
jgi:hypothetical protein